MKDDELSIIYKAVDQMTSVQKKILDQQERMLKLFASSGKTAETAGIQTQNGMIKAGKGISSVEGQIARLNHALKYLGVQLDTIDIYMISAFKVTALWGLVNLLKTATEKFEVFQNTVRGVGAVAEYMGLSSTEALVSMDRLAKIHKMTIFELSQSYRNLVLRGLDISQIEAVIDSTIKAATVLGTQGGQTVAKATEVVSEAILEQRSALLDNARMTANFDVIYANYARTIGTTADALKEYQKDIAVVNYLIGLNTSLTPAYNAAMESLSGSIKETSVSWEQFVLKFGKDSASFRGYIQDTVTYIFGKFKSIESWMREMGYAAGFGVQMVAQRFSMLGKVFVDFGQLAIAAMKDVSRIISSFGTDIDFTATIKSYANFTKAVSNTTSNLAENMRQSGEAYKRGLNEIRAENKKVASELVEPLPAHGLRKPPIEVFLPDEKKLHEYWTSYKKLSVDAADRAMQDVVLTIRLGLSKLDEAYAKTEKTVEYFTRKENLVRLGNEKILALEAQFAAQSKEIEVRHLTSSLDIQYKNLEISKKDYYEKKIELTNKLIESEKEYLAQLEKTDTTAWRMQITEVDKLSESLNELNFKAKEVSGTFEEGLTFGVKKFMDEATTSFEAGVKMVGAIENSFSQTFSNIFNDLRNNDLKGWQEYLTSFTGMIMQALTELMVKIMVVKLAMAAIGGIGGGVGGGGTEMSGMAGAGAGLVYHTGTDSVERLHRGSGLGSSVKTDEVLAILQTKERVMSRSQSARFEQLGRAARDGENGSMPTVVNNFTFPSIDAGSTASFIYKNKDAIAGTVMAAMRQNHPIRRQ